MKNKKQVLRLRRHRKIRQRIKGTKECPRLCVYKSNRHVFAQIIDDVVGKTLVSFSDVDVKKKEKTKLTNDVNVKEAKEVGKLLAEKAVKAKLKKVVFDRGGFKYHGIIKAVADGAREGGLLF